MRFVLLLLVASLSAPATAATFHAQPAAAPSAKVMVRDIGWRCGSAGCVTTTDLVSPAIACAGLARKIGRLSGFSSNGVPFAPAALDRCNARAR